MAELIFIFFSAAYFRGNDDDNKSAASRSEATDSGLALMRVIMCMTHGKY